MTDLENRVTHVDILDVDEEAMVGSLFQGSLVNGSSPLQQLVAICSYHLANNVTCQWSGWNCGVCFEGILAISLLTGWQQLIH